MDELETQVKIAPWTRQIFRKIAWIWLKAHQELSKHFRSGAYIEYIYYHVNCVELSCLGCPCLLSQWRHPNPSTWSRYYYAKAISLSNFSSFSLPPPRQVLNIVALTTSAEIMSSFLRSINSHPYYMFPSLLQPHSSVVQSWSCHDSYLPFISWLRISESQSNSKKISC